MPISKSRKKKGKAVKPSRGTIRVDPDKESAVSLQDLINVLAYQEYVKDGTIDPETAGEPRDLVILEETPGENWGPDNENDQEEKPSER